MVDVWTMANCLEVIRFQVFVVAFSFSLEFILFITSIESMMFVFTVRVAMDWLEIDAMVV